MTPLEWGSGGYYVHRLKANQKAPGTPHGHHDATINPAEIEQAFASAPKANIGVALLPSNVFVIAPDCKERLAEFEALGLPDTMIVQSGSGPGHVHYWYRRPEGCAVHRLCRSGDFDLMTNGYAVVPPSVTTGPYIFLTPYRPVADLPFAPAWAVEMLNEAKASDDAKPAPAPLPSQPLSLSDQEIVDKMLSAKNGGQTGRLMAGDLEAHNGHDHSWSGAVLAFLSRVTFYTQDEAQIERIFEHTSLYQPKKWRGSFRTATLRKALQRAEFYEPPQRPSAPTRAPQAGTNAAVASADGGQCGAELARIAELEQENERLKAEVAHLRQLLQSTTKHHSITERIHNNPGLTPAKGQIATNVVNEVASKISTGQAVDGWVKIRLDAIVKTCEAVDPETGELVAKRVVSKQTASRYIDELAEVGVWEVNNETRYNERSPISDKYIRLLGEPSEALELLSTIVLEKRKQGGSKKGHRRCRLHPDAGVDISRVTRCAECREILDEQHQEHVPTERFQNGTVESPPAANVDDVLMAPKMEPSPAASATRFQHETVLERRQALRETRPAHRAGLPAIPGSLDDRIVAMVAASPNPLDERSIAVAVGRQPRDVRETTNALIQRGRLKRWPDGLVTVPTAAIGAD